MSAAKVSAIASTAACTGPEVMAGITDASTTYSKPMIHLGRRAWLRSLSLALGGLGASRLLGARPVSPPTAGASSPPSAGDSGVSRARLSLNENPYGPAPGVTAAIQREFSSLCRYTGA